MSGLTETPQQRDRAKTIFEKSQPGRRAFVPPALDVPEDPDALPERFRRREAPRRPGGRSHAATQAEIDRLLDKISATGIESLTPEERQLLSERSRQLRGH